MKTDKNNNLIRKGFVSSKEHAMHMITNEYDTCLSKHEQCKIQMINIGKFCFANTLSDI